MARPKKQTEPVEEVQKTPLQILKEINRHLKSEQLAMADSKVFEGHYLPTDIAPIDDAFDGGLAIGRITELYGEFSTAKSYIALKAIAACQRRGGVAALIDTERSFDPVWAQSQGVDLETLIVWPNLDEDFDITAESAIDKADLFLQAGVDLLIFDSVAAMVSKDEGKKSLADDKAGIANLARVMSRGLPRLVASNRKTAVLFINQLRTAGIGSFFTYLTTTGGKSLAFYASARAKITKKDKITETIKVWDGESLIDSTQQVAQKYQMVIEKSKLNRPFKESWFVLDFRTGEIDEAGYLIGQGLERGLIIKPAEGNTWSYGDFKVVGKDKFKKELIESGFIGQLKEDLANGIKSDGDNTSDRSDDTEGLVGHGQVERDS